jgi:hypothetical protein
MVSAIGYDLYAGVFGRFNPTVLSVALGLVTLERVVFVGNGWRCPLTTVAVQVVGREGKDYAPMIPDQLGRYTPALFGSLFGLGLLLLMVRVILGC